MLRELDIRNFAIIDTLSVSFTEGMTVLTGETGAGKSIIIDAVHLLAGGRGSQEFIRHGAQKAEIEGLFHIESEKHPVHKKLEDFGIKQAMGMSYCAASSMAKAKTSAASTEIGHHFHFA